MILTTAAQLCFAENVLSMDLKICKGDKVSAEQIIVEDNYPTKYVSPGDYRLTVTDESENTLYQTQFGVEYILFSDPPEMVDCVPVSLSVPYGVGMKRLSIYDKDKEIYSQEISLCNGDGVCDIGQETYLSCPKDCPLNKEDDICIGERDGICDPDCIPGADPDCLNATKSDVNQPAKETKTDPLTAYLLLSVVIILAASVYVLYHKRKARQIAKQRREFEDWKYEQDRLKKA